MNKLIGAILITATVTITCSGTVLANETQNNCRGNICSIPCNCDDIHMECNMSNIQLPNVVRPNVVYVNSAAPNVEQPNIEIPDFEMPNLEYPSYSIPNFEMPSYETYNFETPNFAAIPNYEIPNYEIPNYEMPNFEIPNIIVPNIEVPIIEIPNIELPNTEIQDPEISESVFELFQNAADNAMNSAKLYKGYIGIYDFRYLGPVNNDNNKQDANYVNPVTGDIIDKKYDEQTGITETYVLSERNNNPSLLTKSYPDNTTEATITADGDKCVGNNDNIKWGIIIGDNKSTVNIILKNSSSIAYTINEDNKAKNISLSIDKTSQLYVTGTSYINELVIEDNKLSNIIDNGNTIYYDADNVKNSWLGGKTIELSGGGKLVPIVK